MMREKVIYVSAEPVASATAKVSHDPQTKPPTNDKEALIALALFVWNLTKDNLETNAVLSKLEAYANGVVEEHNTRVPLSDEDLESRPGEQLRDTLSRLEQHRTLTTRLAEGLRIVGMLMYPDGQLTLLGLAKWCDSAFPQVTMGHKFCAALLVSGMSDDALEFVKAPWNAFIIEVPDKLLFLNDTVRGGDACIRRVLVTRFAHNKRGEVWGYIAFTDTELSLWRFGAHTEDLQPPEMEGNQFANDPNTQAFTDQDKRVTTLIGRLIINTCLAMSDPSAVKEVGPGHKAYATGNKRTEREPIVRSFQVGKPIRLDFRDAVTRFVRHGAHKAPSVQVLVCGHYKMQPHGPQSSLRKLIWREPFWRGPEGAPILVRPHALGKDEKETH